MALTKAFAATVIICTYQPRNDYLERVLAALSMQTCGLDSFELIVVDNGSKPAVDEALIGPFRHASVVREERRGLVAARVAGIQAARSELIVFVDDDNVVGLNYLECCLQIADDHQQLGAWGGSLEPEFESPPCVPVAALAPLGLRNVDGELWALLPRFWPTAPFGAGMCVRSRVARAWAAHVEADASRRRLGASGASLMRGEDIDLAFTCFELGLGTGLFPDLRLTHLIPPERTEMSYLRRLYYLTGYSGVLVHAIHGGDVSRAFGGSELLTLLGHMFGAREMRRLRFTEWRGRQRALARRSAVPPRAPGSQRS